VVAGPGAAVAVVVADCAPVALASPEGIAGVAHAGWRGLEAGVIQATVAVMRGHGARLIRAAFSERHSRWSPGLVLRAAVLHSCIEEGLHRYYFLG